MKKLIIISIATVTFILVGTKYFNARTTSTSAILVTPTEAQALITQDPSISLIDVRTPEEWETGVLPGTTHFIDFNSPSFSSEVQRLDTNQIYLVYCRSGSRSQKAVDVMANLGFTQLYALDGGVQAWQSAYSLVPYSSSINTPAIALLQRTLDVALLDELKAENSYSALLNAFGPVKPFVNILRAEKKHSSAILSLYTVYNLIPPIYQIDQIILPTTITEACLLGVQGEEANIKLYDDLLKDVQNFPDVIEVFQNLQRASQQNHLPAFKRCAN